MTAYFFDSSAIIKAYVREVGSLYVTQCVDNDKNSLLLRLLPK